MSDTEPTVEEALQNMITHAIHAGRVSEDKSHVCLSIDALTMLHLVTEQAQQALDHSPPPTKPEDIRLVNSGMLCPEQYDAYLGDLRVGYLRVRFGMFRVEYIENGNWHHVYHQDFGNPTKDSFNTDEERETHLRIAREMLARRIDREQSRYVPPFGS